MTTMKSSSVISNSTVEKRYGSTVRAIMELDFASLRAMSQGPPWEGKTVARSASVTQPPPIAL